MALLSFTQACEQVFDIDNCGVLLYLQNNSKFISSELRLMYLKMTTKCEIETIKGERVFRIKKDAIDGLRSQSCKIYLKNLPVYMLEDEVVLVVGKICRIKEIRINQMKGVILVSLYHEACSHRAVELLDGFQIRPGQKISASRWYSSNLLYIGNIERSQSETDLQRIIFDLVPGVNKMYKDSHLHKIYKGEEVNDGHIFLEFESNMLAKFSKKIIKSHVAYHLNSLQMITVKWVVKENEPKEYNFKVLIIKGIPNTTTPAYLLHVITDITGGYNVKEIKVHRNCAIIFFYSEIIARVVKTQLEVSGLTFNGSRIEVEFSTNRPHGPITFDMALEHITYTEKFRLPVKYWDSPDLYWIYSHNLNFYLTANKYMSDLPIILFCHPDKLYSFSPTESFLILLRYRIPQAREVLQLLPYLKRFVTLQIPPEPTPEDLEYGKEVLEGLKFAITFMKDRLNSESMNFRMYGGTESLKLL